MYYLLIDTETTNSLDDPLAYDFGFAVIDEEGKVYESGSYVVADVFLQKDLMETAYFADKIPSYWSDIKAGKRLLRRWNTIKWIVHDIMAHWGINQVIAHNVRFDYCSTATTQRYLTSSKWRYFFPYGTRFIDTLKMAREVLGKDETYRFFCEGRNYLTKNGGCRYTAEIVYQYLTLNDTFVESHTALEDVMIEKEIFAYCKRVQPELTGELWA